MLPFVYYRSYRKAGISATIVAAYTSALRTVLKEIPRDLRGRTILSPSPELNLPVTVRLRLVARLRTRSGALKRERVCLSRCFNATVATYISIDPVSRKSNCIRPRLYRLFTILFLPRPARRTRRIAGKSGAAGRRPASPSVPLSLSVPRAAFVPRRRRRRRRLLLIAVPRMYRCNAYGQRERNWRPGHKTGITTCRIGRGRSSLPRNAGTIRVLSEISQSPRAIAGTDTRARAERRPFPR